MRSRVLLLSFPLDIVCAMHNVEGTEVWRPMTRWLLVMVPLQLWRRQLRRVP